MALICVVVVAYRSDATMEHCIKALEAQSFRDFEVILIDNGMTPSLESIVVNLSLKLRIIKPTHNLGFAAGNNRAVQHAAQDTQWVAMLNPDAYARADWLENFVQAQTRYPGISMFGSLQIDPLCNDLCDGIGDCYCIFGLAWRRGHGRSVPKNIKDINTFSPCAAACFYRLDIFRKIGGFDEDYFCYLEDVDLGFRARLNGSSCVQLANVVVSHVGGASSTSAFAVFHGLRNTIWTYVKNMPNPLFVIFLPGMILAVIALAIRHSLSGNGKAARLGIYHALTNIGSAWNKRKSIQRQRNIPLWEIMRVMTWRPLQPLFHLLRPSPQKYFSKKV